MRFFSNIIFFSLLFTFIHAATFEIQNSCPYTVWAAAIPGGGRQLDVGQTWMLDIKPGTTKGRIWARTNCTFDSNGDGICLTGDCNGLLECQDFSQRYFIPKTATRVEYALNLSDNRDFMDITLVDGFNIPIELIGCQRIRCTADITRECPDVLRSVGGCNNPCTVFKTDEYCCNSGECGPTNYSRFFKERCPDAYSYPKDDATSIFTCPGGTNYVVQFCPLDFYFYFEC